MILSLKRMQQGSLIILSNLGGATSLYESLQMEDVGKRSHYEEVQRYQNASTTAPYEGIDNSLIFQASKLQYFT